MAGSARKPYLRLKKSLVDFFRAPIVYLKQINQKFSSFEKPYLDNEYQQMHLNWPSWDWGGPWTGPKQPPTGPFGKIPVIVTKGCVVHCWHWGDCEDWIECSVLHWGGGLNKQGSVEFVGDVIEAQEIWDGPVDFKFKINPEVTNPVAGVNYTDPLDQVCFDVITIECISCNSNAVIGYTTLGMQVDEEQTLEAQVGGSLDDNTSYTWAIASGGGSLSSGEGNSITYTAPSSNAECVDNPTIELSCNGAVIDSIIIAVNEVVDTSVTYECFTNAGGVPTNCYEYEAGKWSYWTIGYDCGGTARSWTPPSGANSEQWCIDNHPCNEINCSGPSGCTGGWCCDGRTDQDITDGCCPGALL